MNKPIKLTFLLILACLMLLPVNAQNTPEWQSQYAVGLNKLAPHTYVWPYASATDVKKGDYEQSPYYLNLNGKWKFHWVKNPDLRPKDFYKSFLIFKLTQCCNNSNFHYLCSRIGSE